MDRESSGIIFIDLVKRGRRRFTSIEYAGFSSEFIKRILESGRVEYERFGDIFVVEGDFRKELEKLFLSAGVDRERLIVAGRFSLADLLSAIKRGKRGVLICPRCGSRKIRRLSAFSGWLLPLQYVCEECGYVGTPISVEDRAD